MAVDQHKNYSKVVVLDNEGNFIEEEKLNHSDKQRMYTYFKSYPSAETRVVLEATGSWYWLVDLLEEADLKNIILAHPYKTRIIAESKIKTDSIDAGLLAQLNRADLIPQSFLADKQTRSLREELRYRLSLVKIRSTLKCKIHSLLDKEGINLPLVSDLFGRRGLEWLKSLQLPPIPLNTLKGYLKLIEELTKLINQVDKSIKEKVKESLEAQLLQTIPGIGYFSSHLILSEIVDIQRFPSPKKLASYAGIVPSIHQSGNFTHTGKITKQGNKYLRWILMEASQKAQEKDPYLKTFYEKISYKKGKQKAKVAIANKLAHIIWQVLKYKQAYKPYRERIYPQASPANSFWGNRPR